MRVSDIIAARKRSVGCPQGLGMADVFHWVPSAKREEYECAQTALWRDNTGETVSAKHDEGEV